jgi:hypothetical protein
MRPILKTLCCFGLLGVAVAAVGADRPTLKIDLTPDGRPALSVERQDVWSAWNVYALISRPGAPHSWLVVYAGHDQAGQGGIWRYTLTLDGTPGPQPEPDPQPDPKPDPPPVPTELWAILVEESAERTPAQSIVLGSPEVRGLFPGRFRILDKDIKSNLQTYIDRSKGKQLPVLFLVDKGGTIYYEGALPPTVAEMVALVKKYKPGAKP